MVINVSRGAVVSVDLKDQQCLIECQEGRLWITKTGAGCDYCLEAGETCDFSGTGKVVVGVAADARIAITGESDFAFKVSEGNRLTQHSPAGVNISQHFRLSKKYNPLPGKC